MTLATVHEAPAPLRVRVTTHAVPDAEAPYDDGGPPAPPPAERPLAPCRRGAVAPPVTPGPPALRLVPLPEPPVPGEDEDSFDAVRTPRGALEDPVPRAAMLTRALLEAIAGVRPMAQLAPWVSAEVLAIVQSMVASRAARPTPTSLRRVLVSEPAPGVAEVTALVQRGARVEAIALRLEGLDGRWLVTALQRA